MENLLSYLSNAAAIRIILTGRRNDVQVFIGNINFCGCPLDAFLA